MLTPLTVFAAQPTFNAFWMNVISQNTQMSTGDEFGLRWQTLLVPIIGCDTAFPSASINAERRQLSFLKSDSN
jgi:hypothetical protein